MEKNINTISCPNCGAEINVSDVLSHSLEEKYRKEFNDRVAREQKKYEQQMQAIAAQKHKLEEEAKAIQKRIDENVNAQLAEREKILREKLKNDLQKEQAAELMAMQKELQDKSNRLKDFNKTRAEVERLKREKEEQREEIKALAEKEFNERLARQKKEIREQAEKELEQKLTLLQEENEKRQAENRKLKERELELLRREQSLKEQQDSQELIFQKKLLEEKEKLASEIVARENEKKRMEILEYQKKLNDQKSLIEEMQRKAEQGSMQMQGEVQELALEELLRTTFPFDAIDEVAKGVRGADVVHTVRNAMQQACGKILYESKRTKNFSEGWIEKLKADQRDARADVAVIVTEVLPKDMRRFGQKSGVWICTFQEVTALVFVLREMLLKLQTVKAAQENRGDKMSMLYSYLTSPEFSGRVEAIVEGFSEMKNDLDKEKRAMQKIWKLREKQIEKVLLNTADMYGAIRGIAGNAIGTVPALELPAGE